MLSASILTSTWQYLKFGYINDIQKTETNKTHTLLKCKNVSE